MSKSEGLPRTIGQWHADYQENKYETLQAFLSAGGRRVSGSTFRSEHFICLRAIRQSFTTEDFRPVEWLMDGVWDKAKEHFEQDKEWYQFLQNVGTLGIDGDHRYQRSALDLVRYYQNKITKTADTGMSDASSDADMASKICISPEVSSPGPQHSATRQIPDSGSDSGSSNFSDQDSPSRGRHLNELDKIESAAGQPGLSDPRSKTTGRGQPSTPVMKIQNYSGPLLSPALPLPKNFADPAEDEQLVNVALNSFLDALTFAEPSLTASWTLRRAAFRLEKIYEARVDGYLQHENGAALILLEVKPYLRQNNEVKVQMQETAQVAAWIYEFKGKGAKKLENGRQRYVYCLLLISKTLLI